MTQLILEFPLSDGSVTVEDERLLVELGNGVRLTSSVPGWVQDITKVKLQVIMETTGSPPDATTEPAPII